VKDLKNQRGTPKPRSYGDSVNEDVWSDLIADLHKLAGRRCELQDRVGVDRRRAGSASRSTGFRIAIIGAPKSGKTCILNSLIGLPIFPMPVVPASSGPIWLKWGEEKRATLRNAAGAVGAVEFADLESPAETDSLELQWPLALCKDGVEFVEVPAYPRADGTSRQELETADLVLLVLSCRALASKADLALIESAAQLGLTEILFVCNHSDGISPEDMNGLELRSAALLQPRTTVPGQAVFFVSGMWALEGAEGQDLGLVERSGIDALRCAIADYVDANQNRAKAIKLVATARLELDAIQRALEQAVVVAADQQADLERQSLTLSSALATVDQKRHLILSQASQFQETTCAVALQRVQNFLLDQASVIENRNQSNPTVIESISASLSPATIERAQRRDLVVLERKLKEAFRGWVETELLPSIGQSCDELDKDLALPIEDFTCVTRELRMRLDVEGAKTPYAVFTRFESKLLLTDLASARVDLTLVRPAPESSQGISSIFYTAIAVAVTSSAVLSMFLHLPILLTAPLACGGATMYSHSRITALLSANDRGLAKATAEAIRNQSKEIAQAVAGSVALEVDRVIDGLRRSIGEIADNTTNPTKAAIDSFQSRIQEIGAGECTRRESWSELNILRAEIDEIASQIGLLAGA
jgi:hypothetical protein